MDESNKTTPPAPGPEDTEALLVAEFSTLVREVAREIAREAVEPLLQQRMSSVAQAAEQRQAAAALEAEHQRTSAELERLSAYVREELAHRLTQAVEAMGQQLARSVDALGQQLAERLDDRFHRHARQWQAALDAMQEELARLRRATEELAGQVSGDP